MNTFKKTSLGYLFTGLITTAVLTGLVNLVPTFLYAACPNTCCSPAGPCGTAMSACSYEQEGNACNGCDGTAQVRVCADCTQSRSCTATTAAATTCGNKFTGTCTQFPVLNYMYCKQTAAGGTHSCTVQEECTGDTACPPNG